MQKDAQLNIWAEEAFKTFICYRGSTTGNSAGKEIANCLHSVLSGEKEYAPVFLAEEFNYDFISDLESIFRSVERFVVVLNVNFFSDFFRDGGEPEHAAPNEEAATLKEIKMALDCHCELYVVFSGEFSWDRVDPLTLRKLGAFFGEEALGRLRHVSNPYQWKQSGNSKAEILDCFNKSRLNGLRRFLRGLEADTERSFEGSVTQYANRNNSESIREYLKKIVEEEGESDIAYAAFYLLQVMLRQRKDFGQMRENFRRWGQLFESEASYSHIWVLYLIESGEDFDVEEALALSETDCETFPDNAGFVHLFADVYATVCERADPQERAALMEKWGARAEEMVDKAIKYSEDESGGHGYAKYYCTKARILALRKEYREAEHNVNLAIDKEDSERKDYVIRLLGYQYHKTMIQMEKKLDERFGEGKA